ncbi:type II secretion system F family protein [Mucisphaera calidilacus]|uniref:Type II secretion system protein F n=1 Tax=Mucisphaera calidilacus TaxID=2527982 RepID=A0A518BXG0_9BACT|nr:type II secretion system F family protein [Mucisphaera calidilacus]QDU71655.1 Type II secretion system protein F [Mucisphaera calidilacus]
MPTFQYEALNDAGKPQKGTISASTSEEAISRIRSQGLFPTSVREQKAKAKKGKGGKQEKSAKSGQKKAGDIEITIPGLDGVSQKQLTTFTRQLSTLQDAGLPILRSIDILHAQQKAGKLKRTLGGVYEDVSSGSSLSDAMGKHPGVFDTLFTKMIAAGEIGGVLDLILKRLAEFLEKAEKLKRRIKGALTYPISVILIAAVIVLAIMIFIIPSFMSIFEDFDAEMPALTIFLMNASAWLAGPILAWLGADAPPDQVIPGVVWVCFTPFIAYFALKVIRMTNIGKATTDWLMLKMPVVGGIARASIIARFTRTLGTLIHAGVPILDAITITSETAGNYIYAKALMGVHDSVKQGDSFSEPLRKAKVCDSLVTNMLDVGEETGDLDKMLIRIADDYDEQVDVAVASLTSLLEPVMIVVLGGIVGTIVIAMFLPMVALMQAVM